MIIINCITYYLRPKYVIMKGIQIENRAILFLGKDPKYRYNGSEISFSNIKNWYYSSNILCRVWTFKQLIKWRRLLPKDNSKCLKKEFGKWKAIS